MPVIRRDQARRVETPNAIMTTLASPSQGGSETSVWRVDMPSGRSGPLHVVDAPQVWAILGGSAKVRLGDEAFDVSVGDTMVLPAEVSRRITAGADGLAAIVTAPAEMLAFALDDTQPGDDCAIPVGDKLQPAWVR